MTLGRKVPFPQAPRPRRQDHEMIRTREATLPASPYAGESETQGAFL